MLCHEPANVATLAAPPMTPQDNGRFPVMTPLERVNSMKMPFAELKGVKFTEADKDRVVARMLIRPDLCTLGHTIHGGGVMALGGFGGAAAARFNFSRKGKGNPPN